MCVYIRALVYCKFSKCFPNLALKLLTVEAPIIVSGSEFHKVMARSGNKCFLGLLVHGLRLFSIFVTIMVP